MASLQMNLILIAGLASKKKALKYTNIIVYGCFGGFLDNFRGDIKFKKISKLGYPVVFLLKIKNTPLTEFAPELGLGTSKFVFNPL